MEEFLETTMEVDETPLVTNEVEDITTNGNTETNETLTEEVYEAPSEEDSDKIISISPDASECNVTPQNEQNGDIVELHEDGSNSGDITMITDDVQVINDEEHKEIENGDILEIPFITLDKNNHVVEPSENNKNKISNRQIKELPKDYTSEELIAYNNMFGKGQQVIEFYRLHCTACNAHLGSAPNQEFKRYMHPLLKVLVCKLCYTFYGSGDFDKDEDGSELYCRWCGQGGKVLCCAKCPYVFCQRCIKNNLGKAKLQEVLDSDDWDCFACVPSQTIRLRVIVRALYDYVQSEMNLAAELNQPERLKVDKSLCCLNRNNTNKIKIKLPQIKRKNSIIANGDLGNEVYPIKKKIKLKAVSGVFHHADNDELVVNKGKTYINPMAVATRDWDSQDEEEVVCAPDLSLLMPMGDEGEECIGSRTEETVPPLIPINRISPPKKDSDVQFVETSPPLNTNSPPKSTEQLSHTVPKKVFLNTSTVNPLLSKCLIKPASPAIAETKKSASKLNHSSFIVPSKIVPGTKYDWFEKAEAVTKSTNLKLWSSLTTLTKEQSTVHSLESLATIHNNFQEILHNSIKSLTQIRKNLRNDFIAGLKTLKYDISEKRITPSKDVHDDNDVIIIDNPTNKASVQSSPVMFGCLKLKPASSLLVENAVITIPDDALDEQTVIKPTLSKKSQITNKNTSIPETVASVEQLTDETKSLINRTLLESKFELIRAENLKVRVPSEITRDMLKAMVNVRVIIEEQFGPATPRMRPHYGFRAMNIQQDVAEDIENLLSSSIVLNISKHKVSNNENVQNKNEPVLNISGELTHLSNGIS